MAGTCGYGEGLSGSINAGNFLTSCKVYWLASQEGLCSMEYVSNMFMTINTVQTFSLQIINTVNTLIFHITEAQCCLHLINTANGMFMSINTVHSSISI